MRGALNLEQWNGLVRNAERQNRLRSFLFITAPLDFPTLIYFAENAEIRDQIIIIKTIKNALWSLTQRADASILRHLERLQAGDRRRRWPA